MRNYESVKKSLTFFSIASSTVFSLRCAFRDSSQCSFESLSRSSSFSRFFRVFFVLRLRFSVLFRDPFTSLPTACVRFEMLQKVLVCKWLKVGRFSISSTKIAKNIVQILTAQHTLKIFLGRNASEEIINYRANKYKEKTENID